MSSDANPHFHAAPLHDVVLACGRIHRQKLPTTSSIQRDFLVGNLHLHDGAHKVFCFQQI